LSYFSLFHICTLFKLHARTYYFILAFLRLEALLDTLKRALYFLSYPTFFIYPLRAYTRSLIYGLSATGASKKY